MIGLTYDQLQDFSSSLGNVANDQVRPTIYIETEVVPADGKHFLVCHIAEGKNKPIRICPAISMSSKELTNAA